jgi:hypothetical protein
MKLLLGVLAGAALATAVAAPAHRGAARSAALDRVPPAAPAGQSVYYGHVASLTRKGARYELRFDPAFLLEGTTAERAAVADGVLPPGQPVPNDNYTRDESHRLLTFLVPATARGRVLTKGLGTVAVPVPELAQILRGRNPRHRPLFATGKESGYWIRVAVDTVRALEQQYHP